MTEISNKDKITGKKVIQFIACVLSAFVGVLLFSETTSPLYSDWGYDSAIFQTIGKYWAEGCLPYVNLFDHKGPIIFFVNALGYALCGRTGVFLVQTAFLAAAEYFAAKLLRLAVSERLSVPLSLLLPFVLAANWQEGNTTEEYILPLLFASYYGMFRWELKAEGAEHRPLWAAVYGLTFAFALLTRLTNALGVCLGTAFIVAALAAKQKWENLFQNALAFLLGAALLLVPFSVYFAAHGALYEMWYGTLLFNLDYYSTSGFAKPESLLRLAALIRMYLPGWCLVFAGAVVLLKKNRRRTALLALVIALPTTLFMYTMNDYAHYGICLVPFFYAALVLFNSENIRIGRVEFSKALTVGLCALILFSSGLKIYKNKTEVLPPYAYERYPDEYSSLLEMIPEDGKESFIAFDCPRRLYLETGLRPCFRYFCLQQWMSVNSDSFARNIHDSFVESHPEWVLVFNLASETEHPPVIRDVLDTRYEAIARTENGFYTLYKLIS